jgi:hypothetical protein
MPHREFVAIDGESWTLADDHRYVLLCDSMGRHIVDPEGNSTKACFDFLLSLPSHSIAVAFGLNYDVNMMLRDFGRKRLRELWEDGETYWYDYKVSWIPGKWFGVKHGKQSVRVYEVFGFFQTRFVQALSDWDIPVQDNDELENMKASRSDFDPTMMGRIIDYCHTECTLLVQLMEGLRDALEYVDINLRTWNGAGAIAGAVLRREGVKAHLTPHSELPPEVARACLHAYFGGRTELFQQGSIESVSQYDICSAYPWAATYLPSLTATGWKRDWYRDDGDGERHGVYPVEWRITADATLGPFPYRTRGGRICYPTNGCGWYHHAEIQEALRHYGSQIVVGKGHVLRQRRDCDVLPFGFIPALYEYRRQLKADGLASQKCLKLGINSLYGKLAQGVGFGDTAPPFQSYFWAGEITARTRARMLRIAFAHPKQLIMIATDGAFFAGDVDLPDEPIGTNLGDLEHATITRGFFAQPGVYSGTKDGRQLKRSRGFFAKEIDFESVASGSELEGPFYVGRYHSTRFNGLGSSLMAKDLSHWRTWQTTDRKLVLWPSLKRVEDPDARPVRHHPPSLPDPVVTSRIYIPKGAHHDTDDSEYTAGLEQPLK